MKKQFCINKHVSPEGHKKTEYDVIIIGAGIGGLVCGCYLAKAGKKVLIIEKNHQVGGYCCSFYRNGVLFDACVESLSACSDNNSLGMILNELGLIEKVKILRSFPPRVIFTEESQFIFGKNTDEIINNLKKSFYNEKVNIDRFFQFINSSQYLELAAKLKGYNFEHILKHFFTQEDIIELFSFMMIDTIGLPANLISAFAAVMILKYFFLDSGYYPQYGMQNFSNMLSQIFQKLGGQVLLNSEVKSILLKNRQVQGISLNQEKIFSKIVISNIDLTHTLVNLIGEEYLSKEVMKNIHSLQPSLSALIVYAISKSKLDFPPLIRFVRIKNSTKNIYNSILNSKIDSPILYLNCFINKFHETNSFNPVVLTIGASFKNKDFWIKNKAFFAKKMINNFCEWTGVKNSDIEIKEIATPVSLRKWTFNYKGAVGGWAPLVKQTFPKFIFSLNICGLYFVGHWLGQGHGVSMVAYLGKRLANRIINRNRIVK
jgi:phytoene dehydrogenase-like protein